MSNTATTNLAISLKTNGKWFALTGSVVSFVGDVLLPLAPVVSYVFWVSLGFGVSSLVLYLALRGSRSFIAPVCTFSIIVAAMTGTMYALQETQQGNSGVLAAAIPALQDLQKSLSIVGADVAEIKRVAKVIDARTDVIQKSTERISDTLGKMDRNVSDKLNDIHRNVGNLGKLGGLVDNPTTAAEFYNNAIVHEKRGNRGAALEAYEAYFALAEEEYFDPYVDYIKLLETAYSQSKGERQLAALAKRRPDSVSLRLAGILFKGERDMTEQIRRLLREAPDY
ncbi:MAG: hypothetical protein ACREVW_11795, partial [Burkholderiales bacterium]